MNDVCQSPLCTSSTLDLSAVNDKKKPRKTPQKSPNLTIVSTGVFY